jgi:pyruvate dehydrogenase E2 component (dihydrolipoamide acetyltransferase)
MALFEFRLPDIGEGIAEGEVVAWHVKPGQLVQEDQEMVEVMTDKATVTIGCPRKGRIAQLNASIGERVKVGSVLVVIDTSAASVSEIDKGAREASKENRPSRIPPPPDTDTARSRFQAPAVPGSRTDQRPSTRSGFPSAARKEPRTLRPVRAEESVETRASARDEPLPSATSAAAAAPAVTASAVGDIREDLPGASFFAGKADKLLRAKAPESAAELSARAEPQAPSFYAEKPLATPATRKLARDLGVDLRRVSPSGPHGRVTKDDVRSVFPGHGARLRHGDEALEERQPFVGMRRRIAEHMRMAKDKAAHFTFVEEVEVDRLLAVMERLKPRAQAAGVKLNYLPFILKATALALQKHPILNSMLDEATNELVYRRYYHIGVAAATEQGLVVPVVKHADQKSVLTLAREIQSLAERARLGTLSASELSGSTFTVTSLGKQGGLLATPVLNHPEVGILGVHRVKERPVVRAGQIVIGNIMHLSLSLDHRIVDGHVGAAFAYDLIAYLEEPELFLLELT